MTGSRAELISTTKNAKGKQQGRRKQASRRQAIIDALRRCMIDKGYAETSLTDLATAAGMTVSHLLYYYASKELILLDLAEELHRRAFEHLTIHRDDPPEERIHTLVDNLFVRHVIAKEELSILQDIMALAKHLPELREMQTAQNKDMISFLQDLFASTPRQPGLSAFDSAEVASALWVGFMITIGYDAELDDSVARRLFRRTLFWLANFEAAESAVVAMSAPRPVSVPKPAAKRPPRRKARP